MENSSAGHNAHMQLPNNATTIPEITNEKVLIVDPLRAIKHANAVT
jgi:hypothetical protein